MGEVEEGPAPPVVRRVEVADVVPEGLPGEGGVLGHGARDGGVEGVDALAVHDARGICRLGHHTLFCLKESPRVFLSFIF